MFQQSTRKDFESPGWLEVYALLDWQNGEEYRCVNLVRVANGWTDQWRRMDL